MNMCEKKSPEIASLFATQRKECPEGTTYIDFGTYTKMPSSFPTSTLITLCTFAVFFFTQTNAVGIWNVMLHNSIVHTDIKIMQCITWYYIMVIKL